ncbi:E3 ubiquitin-protein ligase TRIM11-like [Ranitomeya imitator]|uniref:E3 ubiquitin-protein ligase TRIM11-like n=1 Tax=Ranitomeya imitator TaxID=111125 RepID=UPI0037E88742
MGSQQDEEKEENSCGDDVIYKVPGLTDEGPEFGTETFVGTTDTSFTSIKLIARFFSLLPGTFIFRFLLFPTTIASAELRDKLNCSICLSLYTDPVSLRCGHNFCRSCIVSVLDAQEAAGEYSCPDCRAEYPERPAVEKNRKLRNIVEHFSSTQPDMEETRIFCTYCTKSPVPAVKSCLQCETSMCEEHLTTHNKSVNHNLIEPTVSFMDRKCSTHNEILKYYCPIDAACICVSCWVAGAHKAHEVESLDVASEKKKEKLKSVMEKLNCKREEAQKRVQNLKDHGTEQGKKSAGLGDRVALLFTDLRKKLDDLEKRIQGEISRQKDQVSRSVSDLVEQVELQVDKLTKDMNYLEGLCNITDPLTFLQDVNPGDISSESGDIIGDVGDPPCVDEGLVSQILHTGLGNFADNLIDMKLKRQFSVIEKSDILLDIDTAHNNIIVSQDLRSASYSATSQNRPDGPKRFKSCQVLSSRSFSSGRHYWEVDVSQAKKWIVGVAGESLERKVNGNESYIGYNEKSWGLMFNETFEFRHNKIYIRLASDSPVRIVGIYLDYEARRLSFYQVCDPIRHLHTFTASFSEPLYAALYLYEGSIIRIIT